MLYYYFFVFIKYFLNFYTLFGVHILKVVPFSKASLKRIIVYCYILDYAKIIYSLVYFLFVACVKTSVTTDEGDFFQNKIMSRSVNLSSFEYPAIQWSAFDTHEQKVAACEIPDSILPNIPTEESVEICMEYPLFFDVYAFDSPLRGIKKVVSQLILLFCRMTYLR